MKRFKNIHIKIVLLQLLKNQNAFVWINLKTKSIIPSNFLINNFSLIKTSCSHLTMATQATDSRACNECDRSKKYSHDYKR